MGIHKLKHITEEIRRAKRSSRLTEIVEHRSLVQQSMTTRSSMCRAYSVQQLACRKAFHQLEQARQHSRSQQAAIHHYVWLFWEINNWKHFKRFLHERNPVFLFMLGLQCMHSCIHVMMFFHFVLKISSSGTFESSSGIFSPSQSLIFYEWQFVLPIMKEVGVFHTETLQLDLDL